MIQLYWGTPFPRPLFEQLTALDRKIYGEAVFSTPGFALARYQACPDYFTWAADGDRLAGALCTYPVTSALWDRVRSSAHLLDDDISADYVTPLSLHRANDLIALDIVVDAEFRGRGLAGELLEGLRALLRQKQREGYSFGRLYGYAVSEGGRHMALGLGGEILRTLDAGCLFSVDLPDFLSDERAFPV